MRILVTFAVEAEFAPWRKIRQFKTKTVDNICVFEAQVGRAAVDFVVTGMGIENSTRVTKAVLTKDHQFCIASGFAGAVRPEHKIGDILVADAVQLLGKSKTLQCGRGLVRNAQDDGASRVKLLLTSDHVVRTAAEKAQLAPFADFVDMESFGVLTAAHQIARPAVAIRVISDKYDGEVPADVELTMNQRGRVQIRRVVRYLSKHPIHLPALMRLGRDSRTAAMALGAFLEAHIKKTSFLTHGWFPEGENLQEVATR
jgi:adenosylhomocysteine nucleosidase